MTPLISLFRLTKWEYTKLLYSSCFFSFASRAYNEVQGPTYPERFWNLNINLLKNCSLFVKGHFGYLQQKILYPRLDYKMFNASLTHCVNSLNLGFPNYKVRSLDKKLPDFLRCYSIGDLIYRVINLNNYQCLLWIQNIKKPWLHWILISTNY